jgi:hypothetical protein
MTRIGEPVPEWASLWLHLSLFVRDLDAQATDAETSAVVERERARALELRQLLRRSGHFN